MSLPAFAPTSPRHWLAVAPDNSQAGLPYLPQGQAAATDHSWLGGAGGAEAGSKNKFQIGSNGEGSGAALVNKIPYGGEGG